MINMFHHNFLKQKRWKYLREMYTESAPTHHSGFFRISSSIDTVKHIFVYLKKKTAPPAANGKQGDNPYIFTSMVGLDNGDGKLSNCRLEYGNGVFYPETEYDTEYIMI